MNPPEIWRHHDLHLGKVSSKAVQCFQEWKRSDLGDSYQEVKQGLAEDWPMNNKSNNPEHPFWEAAPADDKKQD